MPDRIIRDELLESRRFIGLHSDTERMAFVALLLTVDAFGNMTAEPWRLFRLWRDFDSIRSEDDVAKVVERLTDADLIRVYVIEGVRYLHVPRFRQSLRYIKRVAPLSPWDEPKKEQVAANSPGASNVHTGRSLGAHTRSEVKRSEVKREEHEKQKPSLKTTHGKTLLPDGFGISESVAAWAAGKGIDRARLQEHLDYFCSYAKSSGAKYIDWEAAFMNAVRRNWAKLPEREQMNASGRKRVAL